MGILSEEYSAMSAVALGGLVYLKLPYGELLMAGSLTTAYSFFFLELSDFLRGPTQVRFLRFPVGGKKHPNFFSPAAGYFLNDSGVC